MPMTLDWQADDVMRAVHGQCLHEQSWTAHGVSIDSRSVEKGDLFIALRGPSHDGHDHVHAAFTAGASAAIVAQQPSQVTSHSPLLFVDDTFAALQDLGRAGRQRAAASIGAVTGSVGKTSTKEMLRLMLGSSAETYANLGSLNNHWGVPLSLARLPAQARFGVFELGMNHAGELGPLSRLVQPHVALITTVEAVHLEFFASVEDIADAKAEIFTGVMPGGAVVLNRDNPHHARLAATAKVLGLTKILGFGRSSKADARLIESVPTAQGTENKAEILGQKISYRLTTPGEHLALNALGALLATVTAGADLGAAVVALEHFVQPKGRGVLQPIKLADGAAMLIDESYNASPVAVRAAIRVLGQTVPEGQGRRIIVLGDMRELGAVAAKLHADLAEDIVAQKIDRVYACGELMRHLFDALPSSLQGGYASDSEALMKTELLRDLHAGDIVTVKGSFSMNMRVVVDALKSLGTADATSHQKKAG